MRRILIVAFLLFIGTAALLIYAWPTTQEAPPPASVEVQVDGPEGAIWNGTVTADPGTAFGALVAASEAGGFEIEWSRVFGQVYVSSIGGHDDQSGGWCVQVDGEDRPVSADRNPVRDGHNVRWYWTDGQCDRY